MGSGCSKGEEGGNEPPEVQHGLPILGNAIGFATSPINFIQKNTAELGQIWRTEVVGQEQVFLVGNVALNELFKEENVYRSDPIPYMVDIIGGGEKRLTPFLDGEEHAKRRLLIGTLLTNEAIEEYLKVMKEIIKETLPRKQQMDKFSAFSLYFEMHSHFIARVVGGLPKDYVEKNIDEIMKILNSIVDGLQAKLPINLPFTAFGKAIDQKNHWCSLLEDSIENRERLYEKVKDESKLPRDFVTHLIVNNSKLPVHEQLSTFTMARELHHLTIANFGLASLMTYAILALTSHPEKKLKVKSEVESIFSKNRNEVKLSMLDKMEYTNNFIREVLRFYPIVPVLAPAKAKRDFKVEGFQIKKGWACVGSVFTTNRDPKVYTKPNTFDPDRFSTKRAEDKKAPFPLSAYVPHGGGEGSSAHSHRCMGEMFTRYAAKLYISEILRDYDWELIEEQNVQIDFNLFAPLPFDGVIIKLKESVLEKKIEIELNDKDDVIYQNHSHHVKKSGVVVPWEHRVKKVSEKYRVLGPQQNIQVKHVEDALDGKLHKKLNKSEFATFQETQRNLKQIQQLNENSKTETDDYLDTISFNHLAKMLAHQKELVPRNEFHNINETVTTRPAFVASPSTVEELQHIIRDAAKNNQRAKVVGCGHSWTPVFPEDGSIMITTDKFRWINHDVSSSNESDWSVTFGVGEKVRDVDRYLNERGLCINTNIVMNHVGFGGLISMGCHGTGWNLKTVSDLCIGMKLVDAHGNVRSFTKKEHEGIVWNSLLVNFGIFGVVFEYTISVYKDFNVSVRDYKVPSKDLFGEGSERALRDLVTGCHSSQFFWLPYNDRISAKIFRVTDHPVNKPQARYIFDTFSNWMGMHFGVKTLDFLTRVAPVTPEFTKAVFASFDEDYERVETITKAIHWQKYLDHIQIMCMEFAFPIRPDVLEDWGNVGKALRFVQRRIHELEKEGKYPLNLALEMRFAAGSDALLSTSNGNPHTCFIEIVTSENTPGWKEFSAEVGLEWMKIPGARPHWAKMCQHIPGIADHIRRENGSRIATFLQVKKELDVDPEGMFYTQWISNLLEPSKYAPYVVNHKESKDDSANLAKKGKKNSKKCTIM